MTWIFGSRSGSRRRRDKHINLIVGCGLRLFMFEVSPWLLIATARGNWYRDWHSAIWRLIDSLNPCWQQWTCSSVIETNGQSPPRLLSNYTRYPHSWHFVFHACFGFGFIFKSSTAFDDALVTHEDPVARSRHYRQGPTITSHSKVQDASTYPRPTPTSGNKVPTYDSTSPGAVETKTAHF